MNRKHDKEKALALGIMLFGTKGYNNLGVEEICQSTGMNKGAFYNRFKSKENFLIQSIGKYGNNLEAYITGFFQQDKSRKAIKKIENFYFTSLQAQPEYQFMGCLISSTMSELGSLNENISKIVVDSYEVYLDLIEPFVVQAQKEGDLTSKVSSRKLMNLIHTTFFGCLTQIKASRDVRKSTDVMKLLFSSLKQ